MATRYVDLVGGNDANDGTTFALRKLTMQGGMLGATSGDTIRIMGSPDPTSLGQNATFTNNSDVITLTTAVTANIDDCETAWTASANVTATTSTTTYREGTKSASLATATAFTTGLIAYKALGSAIDFSAYQQISLLLRCNVDKAAGFWELRLCSDAAGATPVNTISIPISVANYWNSVTVDTGAPLGSSIQSVALYHVAADGSAYTVFLDNIIACKAPSAPDSLTHASLISKNTGDEPWMAIESINGVTVKLAGGYHGTASRAGFEPFYFGTTSTQTIHKREPITSAAQNASSGPSGLNLEFGWDRTAMSVQNALTFCRAITPDITLLGGSTGSSHYLNKLYTVGAANGIYVNREWVFGEIAAIACGIGLTLYQDSNAQGFSNALRQFLHCLFAIDTHGSAGGPSSETRFKIKRIWGIGKSLGISSYGGIKDDGSSGTARLVLVDCDIQGCPVPIYSPVARRFNEIIFQNATLKNLQYSNYAEAEKISYINCTIDPAVVSLISSGCTLYHININGDTTNHRIEYGTRVAPGVVLSDTSVRHTASDFSWKFETIAVGTTDAPLFLSVAKVACIANEQRTVKLWMRRGHASLITRLRVKGGLVSGINDDITSLMTAAINTWEQVTIQFTPTQQCVVEVFAEVYGASPQSAWVDDLEVT